MSTEFEKSRKDNYSISFCICTMNRPNELNRCLDSVYQSIEEPDEVIVSDDSLDGQPNQVIVAKYPKVIYLEGPHRGLGSNRNNCIQRATGSHVIFVDDDVCVPSEFFVTARRLIAAVDAKTLITGYEMRNDQGKVHKIVPGNPDFWGLQRVPVCNKYRAIVINATIFPYNLFKQALFDEHLRYGSDEIDMARHAVALDYHITYANCLCVAHYPSPVNRDLYARLSNASRLYATTKAYWQYERSAHKTLAYVLLAPLQLAGSAARKGDIGGIWGAFQSTALACRYFLTRTA